MLRIKPYLNIHLCTTIIHAPEGGWQYNILMSTSKRTQVHCLISSYCELVWSRLREVVCYTSKRISWKQTEKSKSCYQCDYHETRKARCTKLAWYTILKKSRLSLQLYFSSSVIKHADRVFAKVWVSLLSFYLVLSWFLQFCLKKHKDESSEKRFDYFSKNQDDNCFLVTTLEITDNVAV